MIFKSTFTRKLLLTAASVLVIGAGGMSSVQAQDFTAEQKAQIEGMIKDYIVNNGDQVMQGVENFQNKQRRDAEDMAKKALEGSGDFIADLGAPTVGPDDASVTVVEFFDYNCGYCKKAFEDVRAVLESDKDVRVAFMEMPILGPASADIARWSLASEKQGKYFEYHTALMEHKGSKN
jgi:protein-disulfide isomerase